MKKYNRIHINPYSIPLPKCEYSKYPIGSAGCKYYCKNIIKYEQESDDHGRYIYVTCKKHLKIEYKNGKI